MSVMRKLMLSRHIPLQWMATLKKLACKEILILNVFLSVSFWVEFYRKRLRVQNSATASTFDPASPDSIILPACMPARVSTAACATYCMSAIYRAMRHTGGEWTGMVMMAYWLTLPLQVASSPCTPHHTQLQPGHEARQLFSKLLFFFCIEPDKCNMQRLLHFFVSLIDLRTGSWTKQGEAWGDKNTYHFPKQKRVYCKNVS